MNSFSQKAIYRAAKRKSGVRADVNLWPLVGLLLVSLVTFMTMPMPSPYHDHVSFHFYPGRTHAVLQPAATREDAMRISVLPDGQIYFRNSRASGNELPGLITAAIEEALREKSFLVPIRGEK
jgi:biopolymer transport protein ExbD